MKQMDHGRNGATLLMADFCTVGFISCTALAADTSDTGKRLEI